MSQEVHGELVPVGGGDAIPLIRGILTVGRRESCDICMRFPNISGLHAELTFREGGRTATARPAWVISGPYDYAPEVTNLVTVYDILYEVAVDNGLRAIPNPVFYDRDILPIFQRVSTYQWVNAGALIRGHQLIGPEHQPVYVVGVHSYPGAKTMHNLTVTDIHTYYVIAGNTPVLVHNDNGFDWDEAEEELTKSWDPARRTMTVITPPEGTKRKIEGLGVQCRRLSAALDGT